jgi:glucan biosynthesis protein C
MSASNRLPFVDNLRSMVILLVVTMHAAVTYSNFGGWYYMEPAPTDKPTLIFFGMYQSFLQAWFMGFLFLLAGYFVPGSLERKGPRRFLADRMFRLGVPALIYMTVVQPFIVYVLLARYYKIPPGQVGERWLGYLMSSRVLGGSGPMWFAIALLIFTIVYVAVQRGRLGKSRALPGNLQVAGLILTIAVCTFLMRTVQPLGTSVLNMQLGYFSQYVILFCVGIAAWQGDWLARIPYQFAMRWCVAALAVAPAMWLALILGGGALQGKMALFNGGWTWQSAGIALWESFFCVGTCLGLTVLFRERVNEGGPTAKFLSDNAFAVYVFHPPVLIAITLALHDWQAPALIRFDAASVLAIAGSFALSALVLRRVGFMRRVLG